MALINPVVYQLNNFCELSDSHYSSKIMPKYDFFLKKWIKEILAYVLEFMLTLAKMGA